MVKRFLIQRHLLCLGAKASATKREACLRRLEFRPRRWPLPQVAEALAFRHGVLIFLSCLLISGCNRGPSAPPQTKSQVWGTKGPKLGQFKGPRAIVVARDGFVYVADRASRISKWTKDGRCVLNWVAPVRNNGRFEGPEGITDLPDGDLAVTNTHTSRVLIYSSTGKLKSQFGTYGTQPGHFLLVTGITTDKDGFIYCSDYGGTFDRVSKRRAAPIPASVRSGDFPVGRFARRGHRQSPRSSSRPPHRKIQAPVFGSGPRKRANDLSLWRFGGRRRIDLHR